MAIANLVSESQAQLYLGASLPDNTYAQAALPMVVAAASQLVQRYIQRYVPVQDYIAIKTPNQGQIDKPDPNTIFLDYFPIASSTLNPKPRIRSNRTPVLAIANSLTSTYQAAYAYFNTLGDPEFGIQTNVGLTLVTTASGVQASASFPFLSTPTSTGFSVAASGSTGSLTAGTYLCSYSNVNEAGESIRSADVTVVVSAGQNLVFTLPALIPQAESHSVYVSTVGGIRSTETKQNSAAIAGTSFTLGTLIAGTSPSTTNIATVTDLATAINTYANGWQATPQAGGTGQNNYALWAANDLYASEGTMGAMSPEVANLTAFTTDLSYTRLDVTTGTIFLAQGVLGYGGGTIASPWLFPTSADFGYVQSSWLPEVLVQYAAGWRLVPENIQLATLVTIKSMVQELQTVTAFEDETNDKWKGKLASLEEKGLPASARRMLSEYRVYRA